MLRDFLSMFVAFALALFTLAPATYAQYSGPSYPPQEQAGQYPSISQPPTNQSPDQPVSGPADPNGSVDAQVSPEGEAAADQKHGVARLSIVQGDVNVKRSDNGQLTAAVVNASLVTQDRVQTADGSRAEVELDSANLVRLAPNTDLGLADLEYHRYQLQIGAGTLIYRVLRQSNSQVEVDTPSVGFRPLGEGEFRISVLEDGTTEITARAGAGEIFGPRGSQRVTGGQTVLVRGDANDPQFRSTSEVAHDQFDDWSEHRDRDLLASQSYRFVSQDIPGADDLDNYGNWVPSQYGQVWAPQGEPANWSPYSTGQWGWQDYYGWSWIDDAPWGWAPYHYGRWFNNGAYGWCWWPGAIRSTYFWRPALVGFFGWGGFGIGFGLGGLGWCALAPFEAFHRWWGPGYGYGYGRGGFRPYGSFGAGGNIARTYRNAAYRGGAITAGYNSFGGPHQRFSPATRSQLANGNAFRGGQIPISPSRASYQLSSRSAVANPRLASAANRQFYQSSQFRSAGSVGSQGGFARSGVSGAVPRSSGSLGGSSFGQPSHGVPPNLRNNSAQNSFGNRNGAVNGGRTSSSGGWQRFGDPGTGGALRQGFASGSEPSGWHSFGQPQRSTSSATPRAYSPSSSTPRYSSPQYNGSSGSSQRNGGYSSSPYSSAPSRSYSGSSYSTPRYSTPSGSGPRYSSPSYSAPSGGSSHSSGSFGGGGSHGGGGQSSGGSHGGGSSSGGGHSSGGGGGHSGGGGGGHHR